MNNFNGRVNIIQPPKTSQLFNMYDRIPAKQCTSYHNSTAGIFDESPLIKAYFSKENIENIQRSIIIGVYEKSNGQYQIGTQDCESLKIIMRSVYLQNSVNLPNNIPEQIKSLNNIVLNYCINSIYGEVQGYMKYLYDASTLYTPMEHPVLSYTNDKQLEWKKWF